MDLWQKEEKLTIPIKYISVLQYCLLQISVKINKCHKLWIIMGFIWYLLVEEEIDFCKHDMTVCTMHSYLNLTEPIINLFIFFITYLSFHSFHLFINVVLS